MIDSILNSIKKPLGIEAEYDAFDDEIVMHINTVFSVLHNIGASPPTVFMISGPAETWGDFLADRKQVMMVKTYMYLKVKLLFDPPATSFALDAITKQITELEWRLSIMELYFNADRIDTPEENAQLKALEEKVAKVEASVDEVDEDVDDVPDLILLFDNKLV